MCGIAGYFDPNIDNSIRDELLKRMLDAIAHRGPDARGVYKRGPVSLGHNRLSIIDLSVDGNQPMHRGPLSIVYNGEVYNYKELRKSLEEKGFSFKTKSDTEVILAAYECYGENCVEHFVGMWAFAIWDEVKKTLFCSRDRFGIKPFFYLLDGSRFYFGSEYKSLFPSPLFSSDLNLGLVAMGLQLGWNAFRDQTYFHCIHALPEAHNLVFSEDGTVKVYRYWDIDTERKLAIDFEEAKVRFKQYFMESVRLHMRSDVEVGGCLSGGLDSSAIASAVGEEFPNAQFKTFTVYYEGEDEVDERPWVHRVLQKYPHLEPYYFTPKDSDIADSFERAIWHADVPVSGSSPFSQYFVMQLAAQQGIKVLLDGQGSDEMLGGYLHSFYRLIGNDIKRMHLAKAYKELSSHASRQSFSASKKNGLFLKSFLAGLYDEQRLYELEFKRYFPFLPVEKNVPFQLIDKKGSRLNEFLYQLTFASSLPTLLQFEDRNSMAFSIESRVPFLDHRLVEFVFALPDDAKIHRGSTKRILRESMRGLLPDSIADRKDKKGFVTPGEVKWLRGPLSFLLEQNFDQLYFLNKARLKEVIEQFKKGDNRNANLVWRLAVLKYWMQH